MYSIHIKRPYHKPDFYIQTTFLELYDILHAIYGPFFSDDPPDEDAYRMDFCRNEPDYTELAVLESALYDIANIDKAYIALHAGVVVKNSSAHMFMGPTEAGKSTLTAYLCSNGFEYYSDDIAIIDRKELNVYPYPRPVLLRNGGVSVLKNNGIDFSNSEFYKYGDVERTHLFLPFNNSVHSKIVALYFIERGSENLPPEIINKDKAFSILLKSLLVYVRVNTELLGLLNRLCQFPVYLLKYKDMEFVKNIL